MASLCEAAHLAGVRTRSRAHGSHGNRATDSEVFESCLSCLYACRRIRVTQTPARSRGLTPPLNASMLQVSFSPRAQL